LTDVYAPAEDSMLLLRHASAMVYGSVLDVGTGSGILAVAVASKPRVTRVVAVDIDPDAVEAARRRAEEAGVSERIKFLVSDLFEGLDRERFDWILFNPPYLHSEGTADEASWSGGEDGSEVIRRFLSQAIEHLNLGGAIIMVSSSLTEFDLQKVEGIYHVEVLEELPLFFERLYCLLLRPVTPSSVQGRPRQRRRPRRACGL
jgi:release factor glutamine methyltransferase